MANMSYCRFQNTLQDLIDCKHNWDDNDISEDEKIARQKMINIMKQLVENYGDEEDD